MIGPSEASRVGLLGMIGAGLTYVVERVSSSWPTPHNSSFPFFFHIPYSPHRQNPSIVPSCIPSLLQQDFYCLHFSTPTQPNIHLLLPHYTPSPTFINTFLALEHPILQENRSQAAPQFHLQSTTRTSPVAHCHHIHCCFIHTHRPAPSGEYLHLAKLYMTGSNPAR